MTEEKALEITIKILNQVFSFYKETTLKEVKDKFAFHMFLPKEVKDSITLEPTWTDFRNYDLFITQKNMEKKSEETGWMQEKREFKSLKDIMDAWNDINYITTERVLDSLNVMKSDTIYECENVYHSTNCGGCKNIIFCDSCQDCEYTLASQRSVNSSFCIQVDDSANCSNSYHVIFSNKVSNSYFIQDCFNIENCMFCSHLTGCTYCIANIQFEKHEYLFYKQKIVEWLLNN